MTTVHPIARLADAQRFNLRDDYAMGPWNSTGSKRCPNGQDEW